MDKLISAERLKAHYCWWDNEDKKIFDTIVDLQPIVDAVEVVRCKDCKWWKTNYSWNGNKHMICAIEAYEPLRKAEDFCSRGERREDAKTD